MKWTKPQVIFYFSYLGILGFIAFIIMWLAGCSSDDSYYNILGYEINEDADPDWTESQLDSLFFYGAYKDTTGT